MELQKVINIDINKPYFNIITAKQNDSARYLLFNLLDNGVPFVLTNRTVRAYAIKPDNTKIFNDLTIVNATNGQAELQLTTQMLAVVGNVNMELVIYEGTDILSTTVFILEVGPTYRSDSAIESTNEFSALVNALVSADNAKQTYINGASALETTYAPRLGAVETTSIDNTSKILELNPLKKIANDMRKTEQNLQPIKSKVDTFTSGLDNWDKTAGIDIVNNELTITNSNTMGTHLAVALFDEVKNARGIEITLGATGVPARARLAFGRDKQNFVYINCATPYNIINIYTVEGGKLKTSLFQQISIATYKPVAGDKIKCVLQGQIIQVFFNSVLVGTSAISSEKYVRPNENVMAGINFRDYTNNYGITKAEIFPARKYKYLHFSCDDVIGLMKDLADNQASYTNIFDNTTFSWMKNMHDTYGAVFSLYLFYTDGTWDLTSMPTKFINDFRNNADWIKLGFHGYNSASNYGDGSITTVDATTHYNNIISEIRRFAHAYCIDTIPRTAAFSGSLDCCRAWRDAECHVQGFLEADDTRTSQHYLNALQRDSLVKCDDLYDYVEGLYFVRTDMRLEKFADPITELTNRMTNYAYAGNNDILEVFTHESYLLGTATKTKIENICKWAINNDYIFDFPMNNIQKC